jgi:putative ABC transport system permease protein
MLENSSSMLVNKETFAVSFISKEDFSKIDNPNIGYSVKYNEDNKEEFKDYIQDNYFILSFVNQEDNAKIIGINGDLDGLFVLGEYAPIVIIIMVSLIIAIVVSKTIKNELTQLGTLYALGYKKGILIKHYMTYPIVIAVIGSLLGQIPGIMCNGFIIQMLDVEYSLPKIIIDPNIKVIILSILIPLLIIVPINFITIWKSLNHSAVDLMKGNLKEEGPSFLEKRFSGKRLSFKTRFKLKDIIRNLGRTILTVFAICFCGMLLFLVFVMNESMDNIVNKGYEETYQFKNL